MKYTILDAHIKYFQENDHIEFENLLSFQTLEKLIISLEKKATDLSLHNTRDLFRTSECFKKIAFDKNISSIFKKLTRKKSIRLAFDQIIYKNQQTSSFNSFFSLNDFYSFQNLIGAILIDIDFKILTSNNLNKKNNSIFIKSSFPINIENIFLDSNVFLLIGYGELKTIYKHNIKDPNTNYLKQFGYNFGDLLKDNLHPIIF